MVKRFQQLKILGKLESEQKLNLVADSMVWLMHFWGGKSVTVEPTYEGSNWAILPHLTKLLDLLLVHELNPKFHKKKEGILKHWKR